MDPSPVLQLKSVLDKLLASHSTVPAHSSFLDLSLTLLTNQEQVQDDRLHKLMEITGASFPVILAQRKNGAWQVADKNEANESSFITTRRSRQHSSNSSTSSCPDPSDICGSPLKLDIIAELSETETEHVTSAAKQNRSSHICGVPLNKARYLNSLFISMVDKKKAMKLDDNGEIPSLITLCDGQHIRSIVCTVVHLLTDNQNNCLGAMIREISMKPAAEKSHHAKKQLEPPASEVVCTARYTVIDSMLDIGDGAANCQLQLVLEWKKHCSPGLRLLHRPPSDARSVIRVSAESGNTRSTAFSMYQELQILKSIVTGLATTEVHWVSSSDVPLLQEVKDLVEQLSLGEHTISSHPDSPADSSTDAEEHVTFDSLSIAERKNFDFTDHLWKVLQNCSSYADLIEVFQYVLKVLRKGDLQPYIHIHNNSTIAQLVKDSFIGKMRVPSLSGLNALQYLAEIGLQKMCQDFAHIFLHKNLTTHQHLEWFLDVELDLAERLERLERLQNVLEVIIILNQFVKLQQSAINDCTRQMLRYYQDHAVDRCHIFEFVAPMSAVSGVIENHDAREWKMVGGRFVGDVPEQRMYLLSTAQPYDWVKVATENLEQTNTGDEERETTYFLSIIQDTVSLLYLA